MGPSIHVQYTFVIIHTDSIKVRKFNFCEKCNLIEHDGIWFGTKKYVSNKKEGKYQVTLSSKFQ